MKTMLRQLFSLTLTTVVFIPLPVAAAETVTDCDRLTAHSSDPDRIAPGVSSKTMDTDAAIAACRSALADDPKNARLQYQMGRAYGTAGRPVEARPYLIAAAEAGYTQSQYVLAYLMVNGFQGEKNACAALPLFVTSADRGLLASRVALPYHVLRGDFDTCGATPSSDVLAGYLGRASEQTSDYYATLIIDELSRKLAATDR